MQKKNLQSSRYFKFQPYSTYDIFSMYLIGARGNGKTTGIKEFLISSKRRKLGKRFIWLVRYDTELSRKLKQDFLTKIGIRLNLTWEVKGNLIYVEEVNVGMFMPLNTEGTKKGVEYPDVDYVIFDDYMTANTKYLRDEMQIILDLMSTVDRDDDKTRLILTSNLVTTNNPYFNFYGIEKVPNKGEKVYYGNGQILIVNLADNQTFIDNKKQTKMMISVKDTPTYKYMLGEDMQVDTEHFIKKIANIRRYNLCNLRLNGKEYIVCYSNRGDFYIESGYEPTCPLKYELDKTNLKEGWEFAKFTSSNDTLMLIKNIWSSGRLYFANTSIKSQLVEKINRY